MHTKDRLIDLIENTRPKCTIAVNPEVYYLDADGDIDHYGCELWYEGMELCCLEHDGLQWAVRITSLDSRAKCNRMTEILALLGMPQLRVRWAKCGEYIQRTYNGLVMAEYSLPLKQPLRVTV